MRYELTDLDRSLDQPLSALAKSAEANWMTVEAAREQGEARCPAGNRAGVPHRSADPV